MEAMRHLCGRLTGGEGDIVEGRDGGLTRHKVRTSGTE